MKKEITFLLPTVDFHGPPERTNENIFMIPAFGTDWHRLLRRTLVLKNSYELRGFCSKLIARRSQLQLHKCATQPQPPQVLQTVNKK